MRIYKFAKFHQWVKAENISDKKLKERVLQAEQGLKFEANLGGNLYKIRIPEEGRGKKGSFRVILVYKEGDKVFFLYGFKKNDKGNISDKEKSALKKLGKDLLEMDDKSLKRILKDKEIFEVK